MNDIVLPKEDDTYQVFARKYRPSTFADLIGQDVMVQTMSNAILSDRLAQAYILTGVRGVGKTSTARIIARALNCVGVNGDGGPTPSPCGVCENCIAIAEDRHVDVLEMDAASRTGVDDIREVIDGVRYRPTSARYKIYIIDEVHMLSRHAFNALLKTLEEPPEHVKFVFATTEIRKVPVTVLSRCQRFDLRRVDIETLKVHFAFVANAEGGRISEGALHLISRASEGSVRDGLSLLDQAVSHANSIDSEIGEDEVRTMLGLADRSRVFLLLEATMAGKTSQALEVLDQLYREGSDPLAILEDLLDITHWLTRIKVVPSAAQAIEVPEIERLKGSDLEGRLTMATLARCWQMLLKGLDEVRMAPSPIQAAEMLILRLAHTAELPTPEEVIRKINSSSEGNISSGESVTKQGSTIQSPLVNLSSSPSGTSVTSVERREVSESKVRAISDQELDATQLVGSHALLQKANAVDLSAYQVAEDKKKDAANHPLVRAVMRTFPGSTIEEVRVTSLPPSQLKSEPDRNG
jgi:DNA polymerase-3 subunit gamma/tau